jgi:hypothetical protein
MRLKEPSLLSLELKGTRGLKYHEDAYALRPAVFEIDMAVAEGAVTLEAGAETPVKVTVPDLPVNADVSSVTATLEVLATTPAVRAEPISVEVRRQGEQPQGFQLTAGGPPGPRNLAVRLEQGQPFWTHAGSLAPGRHRLPNFAPQLNDYLDRADAGQQPGTLAFVVASDTRAEIRLEIEDMQFAQLQTQTWRNDLDDTIRLDRNLELGFASVERVTLDPIQDNQPVLRRTAVRLDLGGELDPQRLLGAVRVHDGHQLATVSVDYALAQAVVPDTPLKLTGLVAFVRCQAPAELYAEVARADGRSPDGRQPLATTSIQLEPRPTDQGFWAFVGMERPVDLEPDTAYWVVLRAVRGAVAVGLHPAPVGHLGDALVNRGGRLWRSLGRGGPSRTALLDLVYLPGPDNQTAAVEIGLEGGPPDRRVDPGPEVTTLSFDASALAALDPVTVVVRSHARGTLSIANVLQEYRR